MTLLVGQMELAFERPKEKTIACTFSYAWMRRYGNQAKDVFHFELGRKCPNGAGEVFCKTASCKEIHNLLSKWSKSKSTTKTPPAPSWMKSSNGDPVVEQAVDRSGIGGPSLVANSGRKHPGQSKVPTLVPLSGVVVDNNSTGSQLRDSKNDSDGETAPKNSTSKFKKELEDKLKDDHTHTHNHSVKDNASKKTKQKEDRKSRENKEKVVEKDKSKKDKETEKKPKHKDEKKSVFGGLFSSKKDKDKNKEEPPIEPKGGNIYDDPDVLKTQNKPPNPANPAHGLENEALYDVADLSQANTTAGFDEYDDAASVSRNNASASQEPVEYAQPFVRKAQPQPQQGNVYADAREVKEDAWKKHGRSENEEHHMEDYSTIKNMREEIKQLPPLPDRNYDEGEYDMDDTYDRTDSLTKQSYPSENLYGTASRPVGDLVIVPQAKTSSDSEGENLYDEAEYATADNANPVRLPVADTYEEATISPPPPKPTPKPTPKPAALKTSYQESQYEEVDFG